MIFFYYRKFVRTDRNQRLIILKANPISPAKIKSDKIRRRNDGR